MKTVAFKRWMAIALLGFTQHVVSSGFPVVDLANLGQNLINVVHAAETVQHGLTQIQNLEDQLAGQLESLERFDPGAFDRVHALMNESYEQVARLLANLQGIEYSVDQVGYQHDALFPSETDWESMPTRDYEDYYRDWDAELSQATQTAMQTQSALSRIQANNDEVVRILSQVEGAGGEVRQLQAQNQLLAVMSRQMDDMVANLATSGRVAATAAAALAGERSSKRAASQRLMQNLNDRGDPVAIPDALPRMNAQAAQ